MAKRMATIFFIALGSVFLVMAMMVLVLFLAPGFSIFGIKYLRTGTHVVNAKDISIYEKVGTGFTGSITLETGEIPVNVYITQRQNDNVLNDGFYFTYFDNFQGFTSSSFDDPSYTVTKDVVGNVTIKISEFKRLIYESGSSSRYVNLYIPLAGVDSTSPSARVNLTIKSNTSNITFIKEIEDERIPAFNKLSIETNGNVEFKTKVMATTYNLTTNNSIDIGEDENTNVNAVNYILNSKRGYIKINRNVTGDVTATTSNRDIKLISCKNLTVNTKYGDVLSVKNDQKINITGLANITTTAGSVTLGNVDGIGQNKISTSTGSISVDSIENGAVSSSSGAVRIKILNNCEITTNVGKVIVEEIKENVNVTTKRGNIVLGGSGMTVKDVTAYSRLGKVTVTNSSGKINLQTANSDIILTNASSNDITISSGGKLTATGLTGKVTISTEKEASLVFTEITDTTKITAGNACSSVTIKALSNTILNTKYLFSGKGVTIYESNGANTGSFSKKEVGNDLSNKTLVGSFPYLSITGKNAEITVYFDSSSI